MRVLFVDQFSEWGGAQLVLRDLMTEGLRRGWQVHLMAPAGPLTEFCRAHGAAVETLILGRDANRRKTLIDAGRFVPDILRCAVAIRRTVRRSHIDLIVANGPRILPATAGAGCPIVFHAHSTPGGRCARELAGWFARRENTTVIAVSRFAAEWIQSGAVRVVYNGVKDQGFVARPAGSQALRVGIIGRIAPEKGHVDFMRAAREIAGPHPDVRFVVVGTALYSDASYEMAVRELGRDLPVEFSGWAGNVADTLHRLDILAVPSSPGEAATRVIMEAYSAGTPVVAYPSGGIPELVRHGETGILTAGSGYQLLAQAIQDLISNPELTARFSRNGRREWETRFRLERFQWEMCDLVEQAAAVRRAPPAETASCELEQSAEVVAATLHK